MQTWLSLHELPSTQRAYRKDAERLILWAILERGHALSSLTTEDSIAYPAFLRHPLEAEVDDIMEARAEKRPANISLENGTRMDTGSCRGTSANAGGCHARRLGGNMPFAIDPDW